MDKKKDERVYAIQSNISAIDFQLINNYNFIVKSGKKSTLKFRQSETSQLVISEEDGVLQVKEEVEKKGVNPKTALILTLPNESVFAVKGSFDGSVDMILPNKFGYKSIEFAVGGKADVKLDGNAESLAVGVSGSLTLRSKSLKCPSVAINSSGSVTMTLAGEGEALSASVSGACRLYADNFYLLSACGEVSGLAKLTVKAKEQIKLVSSGCSTVNYYGEPYIDKSVTGIANFNRVGKIEKTPEEKQAEKEQKNREKEIKKAERQKLAEEKQKKKAEGKG